MAKKQTKQIKQTTKNNVWGKVAIAFGFVALFVCGMAVGLTLNRGHMMQRGPMTDVECSELEKKIFFMEDTNKQRRLSALYNRQCWKKNQNARNDMRGMQRPIQRGVVPQQRPDAPEKNCVVIEEVLNKQIASFGKDMTSNDYMNRAQVYANLSKRGCPENSENYKKLALLDIDVARAIQDDYLADYEAIKAVNIYKKLEMKNEAEKVFNTLKKMTDPTIDFIMEIEKIINE